MHELTERIESQSSLPELPIKRECLPFVILVGECSEFNKSFVIGFDLMLKASLLNLFSNLPRRPELRSQNTSEEQQEKELLVARETINSGRSRKLLSVAVWLSVGSKLVITSKISDGVKGKNIFLNY